MSRAMSIGLVLVAGLWVFGAAFSQSAQDATIVSTSERLPLGPLRTLSFVVDEGTGMSVDVSPDGRLLTFDLLGQIFTLPISGGNARQLTTGPAFSERPKFSHDGRFIVFSSDIGGRVGLWRLPTAGGGEPEPVPAADTVGFCLIVWDTNDGYRTCPDTATLFAPGGRYGVRRPARPCSDTAPAYELIDRTTGAATVLAHATRQCLRFVSDFYRDFFPGAALTPDGRAFIVADGGKLRRIELPSGRSTIIPFRAHVRLKVRPLVRFPHTIPDDSLVQARRIENPRLSPDGSQVVFGAFDRLWLARLSDSGASVETPRRLTALEVGEFEPVWSPDGNYVAFVTWTDSAGGDGAVYHVRSDGLGAPERLTREPGQYRFLSYSLDGRRLTALRRPVDGKLLRNRSDFGVNDPWESEGPVEEHDEVELVWVSADDGIAKAPIPVEARAETCNWAGMSFRGRPQFSRSRPDMVLFSRVHPVTHTEARSGNADFGADVVAVPLVPARGTAIALDTLLRVLEPTRTIQCTDLLISPTGDRALARRMTNRGDLQLYLVTIPPRTGDGPPTMTFDTLGPAVRPLLQSPADGAEYPSWSPDGQSFTYAHGRTLYRYDIQRADSLRRDSVARVGSGHPIMGPAYVPTAVTIDVRMPRDRPTGTIVFRNARLITMRGDEVIERGDLVVRDRRIIALGPTGHVAIPPHAHVIDATGRTLLPGLFDLHNHLVPMEDIHRTRVWQYEANLAYGVLTSRDPQALTLDFLTYEDRVATGALLGPRMMKTGPVIEFTPGQPVESMAEARARVRRYTDVYEVKYLKEGTLIRRDVRQTRVMAAAEQGLNVTACGHNFRQLVQNAIDGYGGYEHQHFGWPVYADVRRLLALTGITLAHEQHPTAVPYLARKLDTADMARLRQWWTRRDSARFIDEPGDHAAFAGAWGRDSSLARIVADGGRVSVGSHGNQPGYGVHFHLWMYAEGGMPPLEVLRAATLRSAEALGLDRDLGSLEVGKLADLLVLERNPLEKIQNTISVRYVLFNGRLYDADTLDELWPRVRTREKGWWESTSATRY